ncbi:MAG: calcium/sodium antiporter [Pirellulaceae bacterium]|nr:calcium/sodium antiporter [Pirellulaceae bacterium]
MPTWVNFLVIVATIFLVGLGAHWVVESSSRLAKRFGVSELVIGLTVVAFGTSAPEFAVTLIAAFRGQGDISVGNIVGSNIFNLGFILGGCAMVRAIPVSRALLWRDGTVLGATTLLLLAMIGWDLTLSRVDGVILFTLLGVYLGFLYKYRHTVGDEDSPVVGEGADLSLWHNGALLVLGLAAIVVGSNLLIGSATAVARAFGISDWVIGVTIVAAGTSAPEFATSLMAVIRGRYGISVGNLVGSNIFNLLGVLGLAGMLHPVTIAPMARVSLAALTGMVFLVLILMRTGWRISRLEGLILFLVAAGMWTLDFTIHSP